MSSAIVCVRCGARAAAEEWAHGCPVCLERDVDRLLEDNAAAELLEHLDEVRARGVDVYAEASSSPLRLLEELELVIVYRIGSSSSSWSSPVVVTRRGAAVFAALSLRRDSR